MKLLIVGGAGYVGSIIAPVLEKEFECTHFDLRPVQGSEDRTIVADVGDEEKVRQAVAGMDAIIYLAMGAGNKTAIDPHDKDVGAIGPAFEVNVCGLYRFLKLSLDCGVKRFIYASSLSVYRRYRQQITDENIPADAWHPYGLSKRVGEYICSCAAQEHHSASIMAIRLIFPLNEQDWPKDRYDPNKQHNSFATGPKDIQRLFTAAVRCDKPGFHLLQATGDIEDKALPNKRVHDLLGWRPANE